MSLSKKLVIAIDGPSSSGKGTIAKKIAEYFSIPYLNTGALYRALAYLAIEENYDLKTELEKILNLIKNIKDCDLESPKLHNETIAVAASQIAKVPEIRRGLLDLQRNFVVDAVKDNNGAVLDGRDIGTVICPDADYKFFITASVEERAKRRYKQILSHNSSVEYEDILNQLKLRDEQDVNRSLAPLKKALDAIEIDNSYLTIDETLQIVIKHIKLPLSQIS